MEEAIQEANHILNEIPTPESSEAESSDDDEIDLSADIKKPEQELNDSEWNTYFLKQISPEVKKYLFIL